MEVERLTAEIRSLKLQLLQYNSPPLAAHRNLANVFESGNSSLNMSSSQRLGEDCSLYIRRQITLAEVVKGAQLNNEYEVIPFTHFTLNRIYPVDLSLGKRVVEKPIGYKRKDLLEALFKALEILNAKEEDGDARGGKPAAANNKTGTVNSTKNDYSELVKNNKLLVLSVTNYNFKARKKYNLEDFVEGLYRIDPTTGTQYELYFRNKYNEAETHTKVTVMRPFAPLTGILKEPVPRYLDRCNRILKQISYLGKCLKISNW